MIMGSTSKLLESCAHGEDIDDAVVKEVRRRVMETAKCCKDSIDDCDIKWIDETDDMIFRHLLAFRANNPRAKSAEVLLSNVHDAVVTTLKWRRSFGVNAVRDTDIPREFFDAKAVLIYEGSDGRLYVYAKAKKYRKFGSIWVETCVRFMLHEIDKQLKEYSYKRKRGVTEMRPVIIIDGRGFGMSQVDLKNFFLGRGIFVNYYPKTFAEIWLFGMPWWAEPILRVCLKAMPSYVTSFVKIVDSQMLLQDLGPDNVPASLGGSMIEEYMQAPETTATMQEVGRLVGASSDEVKRLTDYLLSIADSS